MLRTNFQDYEIVFQEALSLLTPEAGSDLDLHELAHEVTETFLFNNQCQSSLKVHVAKVVEKNSCVLTWAEHMLVVENTDRKFEAVEDAVDLGRLYLRSLPTLSLEERRDFLSILDGDDIDDAAVEALAIKLRKTLDAPASPKKVLYKFFYKEERCGRQLCYWQSLSGQETGRKSSKTDDKRSNRARRIAYCH